MTRSIKTPRRDSGSEDKAIAAALRLFLKSGWSGVNMDSVAVEAGVARQTLYNRFGSKDALFRAALDTHWAALGRAAEKELDPTRPPRGVLTEIAKTILAFIDDHDQVGMTRMVIAESRTHPDIARVFSERGKAPLMRLFVDYLSAATRAGKLSCPQPKLAARQFLGMIQESLLWPRVMGAPDELQEPRIVVQGAIDVFMRCYAGRRAGLVR